MLTSLVALKAVTSISVIITSCSRLTFPRTTPAEISTDIALMVALWILGRVGKTGMTEKEQCLSFIHSFIQQTLVEDLLSAWHFSRNWGQNRRANTQHFYSHGDGCCPVWNLFHSLLPSGWQPHAERLIWTHSSKLRMRWGSHRIIWRLGFFCPGLLFCCHHTQMLNRGCSSPAIPPVMQAALWTGKPGCATVHGVPESWTRLSDGTELNWILISPSPCSGKKTGFRRRTSLASSFGFSTWVAI